MNRFLKIFWLSLSLVIAVSTQSGFAQDLNGQDIKTLDVDKLTDDQVKKFLSKAEEGGYTEDQLILGAKAQGMSDTQIQKLRNRINKIKSGGKDAKAGESNGISDSRLREGYNLQEDSEAEPLYDPFGDLLGIKKDTLPKIFGMAYFENNKLTFEPSLNIPTPKNYQLGAGDQIIIDIWGDSEQTYQTEISPDGYIRIERLGPIYLNGLEVEAATRKINAKLKTLYGTLGSTTYSQVSLGQIRTIHVNVIGEVQMPGTYLMSSLSSAFNALYLAGGPTETGTLRKIEVYRGGKFLGRLDAYQLLLSGEGKDISLSDGDVVIVKPYDVRVFIDGQIKRPAYYDLQKEETLADLIDFAGGFTDLGYSELVSVRRKEGNFRSLKTFRLSDDAPLLNGDEVYIQRISNRYVNRLVAEGALNFPGEFEFREGMMLSELIQQAGGMTKDAFMGRGLIIRLDETLNLTNQAFNVASVVKGTEDHVLKNEDMIKVFFQNELRDVREVMIEGAVQQSGTYPFIEDMTVEDLILLAKGFDQTARRGTIEIIRKIPGENPAGIANILMLAISEDLSLDANTSSMTLMPFDLVIIRQLSGNDSRGFVTLEGAVSSPGVYGLSSKRETIYEVLQRAGGPAAWANLDGAVLIRKSEYQESDSRNKLKRLKYLTTLKLNALDSSRLDTVSLDNPTLIGLNLTTLLASPNNRSNMTLRSGDIISIPEVVNTISVAGEVFNPGDLKFIDEYTFKRYLNLSGGVTDRAKLKRSYVVYANGVAKKTGHFLFFKKYPKILPGSTLIVPAQRDRPATTSGEIIGAITALASLTLIINSILN